MRLHPEPQPITATDEEIRAAVADVQPVPLLAAVAALTGDLSVLRDDLRPDVGSFDPDAGLGPDQLAAARDARGGGARPLPGRGERPGPDPAAGRAPADPRVPRRRSGRRRLRRGDDRGARARRRGPPGAHLGGGDRRARSGVPRRDRRRRHVGDRDGAPPRPGGRGVRDPGEERRRRRDLAREPLSRMPGRRPEPLLQLLVRADARVAAVLRDAVQPPRLLPHLRDRARRARARAVRDRGGRRHVERRAQPVVDHGAHAGRHRGGGGARARQRGRSAEPSEPAGPPGHRHLPRPVVPLGALGPGRRARGQAGRDRRHGRERRAVHPGRRRAGRAPHGLPAHAAVAARHAQLPRRRPGRDAVAARRTSPDSRTGTGCGSSGARTR